MVFGVGTSPTVRPWYSTHRELTSNFLGMLALGLPRASEGLC
ncbi:hypothetical protein GFS31_24660 [Leptolyngbya sp. BL0902]|nr:hypothetical protein GFS31_24660 [Leptolyngbya sp. BL0902]